MVEGVASDNASAVACTIEELRIVCDALPSRVLMLLLEVRV